MNPAHIEALLARKLTGYYTKSNVNPVVYSSTYRANVNPACDTDSNVKHVCTASANAKQASSDFCHASVPIQNTQTNVKHTAVSETGQGNVKHVCEANVKHFCTNDMNNDNVSWSIHISMVISASGVEGKCPDTADQSSAFLSNVNLEQGKGHDIINTKGGVRPIFDINHTGVEDKFVNSILSANQFKLCETQHRDIQRMA